MLNKIALRKQINMMQTFKKGNISLDKTIALSKQIVKGEVQPSEVIELNTFCGEVVSFEFTNFKNSNKRLH